MLSETTAAWFMEAPEPYIRYHAQLLLTPGNADPSPLDRDPFIRENIREIASRKDSVLERYDKPDPFIHRLAMLADLGVTPSTEGMHGIEDEMLANITGEGTFPISIGFPGIFGGTGGASKERLICDFPS